MRYFSQRHASVALLEYRNRATLDPTARRRDYSAGELIQTAI